MIRKHPDGTYRLYSKKINPKTGKRRHLGTFPNLEAAQNHEWEMEYFKEIKALGRTEMKKIICFLFLSVLSLGRVSAQEVLPEQQRWIEQVDGGCVIPASARVFQNYAMGFGGDVLMGYRFSRQFSLSADLGYYDSDQKTLGGSAGEWDYTPLMAVARYNLSLGVIRPYLLLGTGVAFNSYSLTGGSSAVGKFSHNETDFLLSPGLGALVVVAADMAVYIQGRLDIDFAPASQGLPSSDNPSLFIPIKLGVTFFAL